MIMANEKIINTSEPVLRADHLSIQFGGLRAVDDVNLTVNGGTFKGTTASPLSITASSAEKATVGGNVTEEDC